VLQKQQKKEKGERICPYNYLGLIAPRESIVPSAVSLLRA
jgi:hypothetical protein